MSKIFKSVVRGVGHFVPPKVVTNQDLSKAIDTSDAWITERSGIRERRFADDGVTTSDLAVASGAKALADAGWGAGEVDLIVAATLSPDFFFPGIGTLVQHKLGMPYTPALDIRAQCSGLVFGLATADAYIRAGMARRVLLVCAEIQSRKLDLTTRGREMGVLFGDGAGALALEAVDCTESGVPTAKNGVRGVIDSLMGCDGSGAEILLLRTPGTATPNFVRHEDLDAGAHFPKMEGRTVFKHAITRMTESVQTMLERHGLTVADIDLLIPHQANLRIAEMVREKLGVPSEKVFNNIEKYGNTTAATIPICMSEAVEQGRLKEGMLLVTVAFGSGFTWGCNLVRW